MSNLGVQRGENVDMFLNMVNYLLQDEDFISIRPKDLTDSQLDVSTASSQLLLLFLPTSTQLCSLAEVSSTGYEGGVHEVTKDFVVLSTVIAVLAAIAYWDNVVNKTKKPMRAKIYS